MRRNSIHMFRDRKLILKKGKPRRLKKEGGILLKVYTSRFNKGKQEKKKMWARRK